MAGRCVSLERDRPWGSDSNKGTKWSYFAQMMAFWENRGLFWPYSCTFGGKSRILEQQR